MLFCPKICDGSNYSLSLFCRNLIGLFFCFSQATPSWDQLSILVRRQEALFGSLGLIPNVTDTFHLRKRKVSMWRKKVKETFYSKGSTRIKCFTEQLNKTIKGIGTEEMTATIVLCLVGFDHIIWFRNLPQMPWYSNSITWLQLQSSSSNSYITCFEKLLCGVMNFTWRI